MKVYFDRTEPFYLVRNPTFDGIAVDIDPKAIELCEGLVYLLNKVEYAIENASAPETSNPAIAAMWSAGLIQLFKETNNGKK